METREAVTQEASNKEEWRDIPGYAGLYEASNLGRIRSLDRTDSRGNRRKGRTLKPSTDKKGYQRVNLYKDGEATAFLVHRLVLAAHAGPCPEGQEVRHLNGVPGDNRLSNIVYGTPSENRRDMRVHGTDRNLNKTHCSQGHPYYADIIVPSELKRGWRKCLICDRAYSYIWRKNIPTDQHWAIYDMYTEKFLLET